MERITELKMPIIQKISTMFGYGIKNIFPLKKETIIVDGTKTNIHICRLGLSDDEYEYSDVLIYIDGYGGIFSEIETKKFYEKKVRKPISIDKENYVVYFDTQIEKKSVDIVRNTSNTAWGYYDNSKNYISIDKLPDEPIEIEVTKFGHQESFDEIIRMQNPNLLLYKPENMESALQLLNEECNNNEVLDSSWHLDEKQQIIVYQKIRELCKEESDTKIIYTRYREWFSNWKKENN